MNKLLSTFGMYEMEVAAEIIFNNGLDNEFTGDLFRTDYERTGFYNLLLGNFLERGMYNSRFIAGEEFKRRVLNRLENPVTTG